MPKIKEEKITSSNVEEPKDMVEVDLRKPPTKTDREKNRRLKTDTCFHQTTTSIILILLLIMSSISIYFWKESFRENMKDVVNKCLNDPTIQYCCREDVYLFYNISKTWYCNVVGDKIIFSSYKKFNGRSKRSYKKKDFLREKAGRIDFDYELQPIEKEWNILREKPPRFIFPDKGKKIDNQIQIEENVLPNLSLKNLNNFNEKNRNLEDFWIQEQTKISERPIARHLKIFNKSFNFMQLPSSFDDNFDNNFSNFQQRNINLEKYNLEEKPLEHYKNNGNEKNVETLEEKSWNFGKFNSISSNNEEKLKSEELNLRQTNEQSAEMLNNPTNLKTRLPSAANFDTFRGKISSTSRENFIPTGKISSGFTLSPENMKSLQQSPVIQCFQTSSTNKPNFPSIPFYQPPMVQLPQYPYTPLFPVSIPRSPSNDYIQTLPFLPPPNYPMMGQQVNNGFNFLYPGIQSSLGTTSSSSSNAGGQYYKCQPIPPPSTNLAEMSGIEIKREQSSVNNNESLQPKDWLVRANNRSRASIDCRFGQWACEDGSKCIDDDEICDNEVDCWDSSDETSCSCVKRIANVRICDGYYDCPNGEDEMGCFECSSDQFNCDDWTEDDKESTCIPLDQRCDGVIQCPSSKDEENCSILKETMNEESNVEISVSSGFLFRNFKGKWYSACSNAEKWAEEACQDVIGPDLGHPITQMVPTNEKYTGDYINALTIEEEVTSSCVPGMASFVTCSELVCGTRFTPQNLFRSHEVDTSIEDNFLSQSNPRNTTEFVGASRVVGGKASQPAAWPWMVAIYKNGNFQCGGVLINDQWIITAAHCVNKFTRHYYEVQAGMLRRFSYSPMKQTRVVSSVVSHQLYEKSSLKNDLALVKVGKPFKLTRYLRPVCLPSENTAGRNYISGPPAGTICTAVGWGATIERGSDPDHMREVEVPVLKRCKNKEDEEGNEICAGLKEGGKDACQGDSGGPFLCRNPNLRSQWYVAGIVSHGNGCARPNEPGVYTRVSLYLDWIAENIKHDNSFRKRPLQKCPGYVCKNINKCIPHKRVCDKVVDCMHADDEIDCNRKRISDLLFRHAIDNIDQLTKKNKSEDASIDFFSNSERRNSSKENETLIRSYNREFLNNSSNISVDVKIKNQKDSDEGILTSKWNFYSRNNSDKVQFANMPSISNMVEFMNATTDPNIRAVTDKSNLAAEKLFTSTESQGKRVWCKRILQSITNSKICDRRTDCEDGTDEEDCTCAMYLKLKYPDSICNGIFDCQDLTDENNCSFCDEKDEYYCKRSQQCISLKKRCNNLQDCDDNEDEEGCFALTNGKQIVLRPDQKPKLKNSGIVTYSYQEMWRPLCLSWKGNEAEIAARTCHYLGFHDYVHFSKIATVNKELVKVFSNNELINYNKSSILNKKDNRSCETIYLKCSNEVINNVPRLDKFTLESKTIRRIFPWNAIVLLDGKPICMGVLIDVNWIAISSDCINNDISLETNYVSVVMGFGENYFNVKGPFETIAQIHDLLKIENITLLYIREYLDPLGNVRPLIPIQSKSLSRNQKEICICFVHEINGKPVYFPFESFMNFTNESRRLNTFNVYKDFTSGFIACESKDGWYPLMIFPASTNVSNLESFSPNASLLLMRRKIKEEMEKYEDREGNSYFSSSSCDFRCDLGKCLKYDRICNGIADCSRGEDESQELCESKNGSCHLLGNCKCSIDEMKCKNGKCVSKQSFCNSLDDCGDMSDEPKNCTCRHYLELSHPEKVCDGILNCQDRSDEDPLLCQCKIDNFVCGNNFCVPNELVCDGREDCPENGADENNCIYLKSEKTSPNSGEVYWQTAGIWHSGCYPEKMTILELERICENLGFYGESGRRIYPNFENNTSLYPYLKPFQIIQINSNFTLKYRQDNDESLVEFIEKRDCHKLYVTCSNF